MNIIDKLWRADPLTGTKVPLMNRTAIEQVLDAPADYNRETRRRAGLLSKWWRWDLAAGEENRFPRYVRRRINDPRLMTPPLTRRQRRQRTRMVRLMSTRGVK